MSNTQDCTNPEPSKPNKSRNYLNWILWWRIDKEEMQRQVDGYKTLAMSQSARGMSAALLIFSVVVTVALAIYSGVWVAFIDASIFLILAIFILKGHKWAMIVAMIFWTFEKAYSLMSSANFGTNPPVAIFWWALYMHAFWLAFQVERQRKDSSRTDNINKRDL